MNKIVRIFIAAIFLLGILFLARNHVAWAGGASAPANGSVQSGNQNALLDGNADPGSVKPPPVVVPPITKPGTYSVGGVCTLQVIRLDSTITIHANLLPFSVLKSLPQDVTHELAGVCNVTMAQSGKPITDLTSDEGDVKICFAEIPNVASQIYVFDGQVWIAVETTTENGLVCGQVIKAGKYFMGS